jgi:CheY-like chemotaxis protein
MKRILVVEDDPRWARASALRCGAAKPRAVLAPDLQTAGRMLAEAGTVLVILDVNLPDGSGLELLKENAAPRPESRSSCSLPTIWKRTCNRAGARSRRLYHKALFHLAVLRARLSN